MHPDKFMKRQPDVAQSDPQDRATQLDKLGSTIAGLRKEAIDARKASGIEDTWMACEESYLGIDDANRAEFSGAKWAKPATMNGPLTSNAPKTAGNKSTVFVPLTSRYVDGASSKLAEIILPVDDKAFSLDATPDPDLVTQSAEMMPAMNSQAVGASDGQPEQATGQPTQAATAALAAIQQAADCAEKAETRIYDWLVEGKYPAEARKVIKDAARIGVGILKAPVPAESTKKAMTSVNGEMAMEIIRQIKPIPKWIDPWNFFPADGCGENIHDGDGCFERDYLSSRRLKALKKQSALGYLPEQIDRVLEEGPNKAFSEGAGPSDKESKNRYEVWYFNGTVARADLELMGTLQAGEESDKEEFSAVITLVNDTVIRAVINPLDSGDYPYHVLPWRRRPGHWAGVGVAEQMFIPQRMVNAATRALMNNAGISSGVQIIIDQLGIVPADNSMVLYPNKVWYRTSEAPSADIRDAFMCVEVPSVQPQMMAIIEYGMRMAEEATSIPMITQGNNGPTSPQTFGQAELQNNNATTWLRAIGSAYDDCINNPMVNAFYEWLLLDPSVPNEEKGDFSIVANGSSAMVERAIQEQTILSLLNASANPAFNIDPDKLMTEYLKSKRLDPRRIQLTDEQKDKRAQQAAPPPVQVMVEQARGQNAMQLQQAKVQGELQVSGTEFQQEMQKTQQELQNEQAMLQAGGTAPHMATAMARIESAKITAAGKDRQEQARTARDLAYVEREQQIARDNAAARHLERQDELQLAMLKYANEQKVSLNEIRAQLAQTSMQEQTKKQLAQAQIALNQSEGAQDRAHDMHKHTTTLAAAQPPAPLEPAGQAEDGKAFSQ